MHLVPALFDRPAYVFRPSQVARRLAVALTSPSGTVVTRLPWGLELAVDAHEALGRAVLTSGVYDLPMTETLWRLTAAGDLALDVGANIGYTGSLLAVRAGSTGAVRCYEPHPAVFARLEQNARRWVARTGLAPLALRQVAVSERAGHARLVEGPGFARNAGTSAISTPGSADGGRLIEVEAVTLDDELRAVARGVGVLKVDVEGHEAGVIAGARRLLEAGRVRDIVYEDHARYPSSVSAALEDLGYRVMAITRSFFGPRLVPPADAVFERDRLPPNYLATREPERAIHLVAPRGWACLS